MTTIDGDRTNHARTRHQFLDALTDFGPHRSEIWTNSKPEFLVVHDRGDTWADVTEARRQVARCGNGCATTGRTPCDIVLTTTDSNTWGRGSGHHYTLTQNADGSTSVHAVIVRNGISFKGRLIGALLAPLGKSFISKNLRATLRAIEAQIGGRSSRSMPTSRSAYPTAS